MDERFGWDVWDKGILEQPLLRNALANLEGEITQVQDIGTHSVYMVEMKKIVVSDDGHGLVYFKRKFHPVMHKILEPTA